MNEAIEAIKSRRSVRSYTDEMPPRELIDQVVEAGLWAPSGRNLQGPIVLVVTDPELRARLSRMNAEVLGAPDGPDPFFGAPVVLVVLAPRDQANRVYDGSLVMGNLMLAAHALGLGSCWVHRARQEFDTDEGRAILAGLGIEGEWEGIGHCVLGYPAAEGVDRPRREGRVFYAE